ncbi:protein C3orf33 homolog [Phymastichus coffea]|uniref:protein C3orf33 homolog n=1 Tax=Phymastichus coffea TaxID=108790 RepID=UPI00273BA6B1|nr:protein C3orf33 homolog [Phymastichus coffea]
MDKEEKMDFFERFSNFMEHDTRGVQIITYGVAGIGFLAALYKIRPFARFTSPSDVPKHFFTKKVLLEGTVKNVAPSEQPYLLIDHKPLVPLPRLGIQKYLPVKIAGVNITGNGMSWLQAIVKGQKVKFLPIAKDNEFLTCIVMLAQKDNEPASIGKELLKVGFGTVADIKPFLPTDKDVKGYQRSLQLAQKWAERKRNGIWHFKYSPTILWKIRNNLDNKLKSTLPASLARYFNI